MHHNNKNEPERGVIIGRLESGERFVANTDHDPAVYNRMKEEECVGKTGQVTPGGPSRPNRFVFDK